MLQAVVDRMSRHSFTLKGGAVALATAALGIAFQHDAPDMAFFGAVLVTAVAALDVYYLRLERAARSLFDKVRGASGPSDFNMNLNAELAEVSGICRTACRPSIWGLYGPLAAALLLAFLL